MSRTLKISPQSWPLAKPFRISRGVKEATDVVVVELGEAGVAGFGEGAPLVRYGQTNASCVEQIEALRVDIEAGLDHTRLLSALPPGAARNALDCALWDLEAKLSGCPVFGRLRVPRPGPVVTALTVGLAQPAAMGAAAAEIADAPLIKIKVDGSEPAAQIRAVRSAAPAPRLIVDANEAWDIDLLRAMQPILAEARVLLLEQPLPAGDDAVLEGFEPAVPICADESCHVTADVPTLSTRYQAVNIKLDKTGGLTEALALDRAARARGMTVMVGCMVSTSLSIAPALYVAQDAAFVDVDGPLWLKADRYGGVRLENGMIQPPRAGFWGE
jgi:L-alanine-DL-glutamate epimerase-like enolase superfamily enzyme